MQQVQQREVPERISWARALIFAVGFFFIAAILIGQLPSYIYIQMTSSSLQGFEIGSLSLGVVCMAGFAVIQVIVLLFDPKPLVPPTVIAGLGVILALIGLGLSIWSTTTGCTPANLACNQYFPSTIAGQDVWSPVLGGKFLWFQPEAVDLLMVGLAVLGVGAAMIFYGVLALREQKNPDRRDLGMTSTIRGMFLASIMILVIVLAAYTYVNEVSLGQQLFPARPFFGAKLVMLGLSVLLGAAIFLALGAFALRLHYLMRPVRKKTMSGLYMVGALGLAQLGVIMILIWFAAYPLIDWIHSWSFIGLGSFLTLCSKANQIPASCSFSADAGYLVDTIVTSAFFSVMLAAVFFWKSHRNVIMIGSAVTIAVIAFTALLMHTAPATAAVAGGLNLFVVAMILCVAILVLATIWTAVSRNEFAVVGENNLGCLGQWLVMGTCLFIYIGAFGFFSIPAFPDETEPNINFISGGGSMDAVVVLLLMGILAGLQFYFLTRNRYKV